MAELADSLLQTFMARIQLVFPDKYVFSTEIVVRVSDLNYGGHVGNDTMLTLMQEARIQFYRAMGYKDEISFDGSVGQIVTDATVQYKAESFLGDVLSFKIAITGFNRYGFEILYLVSNKKSGLEMARGKTGIVCFDYNTRKIAPVPASLVEKLTS